MTRGAHTNATTPFADGAIHWAEGHALLVQQESRSCALVGGGLISKPGENQSLGSEIDAHDIVVRINRLPFQESGRRERQNMLHRELGWKTDALVSYFHVDSLHFGYAVAQGLMPTSRYPKHYSLGHHPRPVANCSISPRNGNITTCPFRALVLPSCHLPAWDVGKRSANVWLTPPDKPQADERALRIGCFKQEVVDAVNSLHFGSVREGRRTKPSTGLYTFFALVHACSNLDMYGFDGSNTVDSHVISPAHNLDEEHRLMAHVARHGIVEGVRNATWSLAPASATIRMCNHGCRPPA